MSEDTFSEIVAQISRIIRTDKSTSDRHGKFILLQILSCIKRKYKLCRVLKFPYFSKKKKQKKKKNNKKKNKKKKQTKQQQNHRHFVIQERFNKLVYGIDTIIKCGT